MHTMGGAAEEVVAHNGVGVRVVVRTERNIPLETRGTARTTTIPTISPDEGSLNRCRVACRGLACDSLPLPESTSVIRFGLFGQTGEPDGYI